MNLRSFVVSIGVLNQERGQASAVAWYFGHSDRALCIYQRACRLMKQSNVMFQWLSMCI